MIGLPTKIMVRQYDVFAEVYELLFDETLYYDWKDYVLKNIAQAQLTKAVNQKQRLLDIACGNGELALLLSQEPNLAVSGYDLSAQMIKQAKANAEANKADVEFFEADMLYFQKPAGYEIMTLFCDTLCYLDSEAAVKQTFTNVYTSLTSDGLFMFDIHSEFKMNHQYPGFAFVQEWDDAVFTWNSEQLRGKNTIDHMLNIFVQAEKNTLYERHEELHQEQLFPLATYQRLLAEAGFKNVKITADFSDSAAPGATSERIFFSCQKI